MCFFVELLMILKAEPDLNGYKFYLNGHKTHNKYILARPKVKLLLRYAMSWKK